MSMSNIINADTFVSEGPVGYYDLEQGTVEVTLQGETRRIRCHVYPRRGIGIEICAKVKRGRKFWPIRVFSRTNEREEFELFVDQPPAHLIEADWNEFAWNEFAPFNRSAITG